MFLITVQIIAKGLILFHPNLNFKIQKQITDKNGRYIIIDEMCADSRLALVNIYAPNDVYQQVLFFKELQHQLKDYAEETIIIGGDFNCTLTDIDKDGNPFSRKTPVIQEINNLFNMYELIDIWRQRNPNEEKFTWRNNSFKIQCRLDYSSISRQLVNLTKKCTIAFAPETDHSAIFIHLQSAELKQKKAQVFGNLISHSFTMKLTYHCCVQKLKNSSKSTLMSKI